MFFIMGISEGQKKLDFNQTIVCTSCGKYGRMEVYMGYTYLSLFFIPVFKWNRRYYVKMTCCDTPVRLSREMGEGIKRGEVSYIPEDIMPAARAEHHKKRCSGCGFETEEKYRFCPECGREL